MEHRFLSPARLILLSISMCCFFCALLVKFFMLQIVEGEKWAKQARIQHIFTVKEPARRGVFYSNTSLTPHHREEPKPFVVDIPKFHLYIDPLSIPNEHKKRVAHELANTLGVNQEQKEKLSKHFYKKTRSRRLVSWLDLDKTEAIAEWWRQYAKSHKLPRNAVYTIKDFRRSYPFGHSLGQVLHTIREGKDQTCSQPIPTGGLEAFFNGILQGTDGKRQLLRSPRNPLDSGKSLEPAKDGAAIYLTINHVLQAICEDEIKKAVDFVEADSGWAILMNPSTGEILSLAQYPFFEPSEYSKYFASFEKAMHTKVRAVTDSFEPGSTMKPLSLTLALLANEERKARGQPPLFNPREMVRSDHGKVPGRSKPLKDVGTYKYLNFDLAIQKSSNIYIAKLIHRIVESLGKEWYRQQLSEIFGFSHKTGVELPSEATGMLPTPGKRYKNGRPEWSAPTAYSLAFGYNLLASSLQMARAYCVLANGGFLVKPTLIKEIEKDGNVIYSSHFKKQRVLPKHIVDQVVRAMKYITKPGGSGFRADVPGYTEAGKTGTTEILKGGSYSTSNHFSSFIGFAPAKDPKLLLYIGINEPAYRTAKGVGRMFFGGRCAAPTFSSIMKRALTYLGVPEDDPTGYPIGDPRRDTKTADWYKETAELRKLYQAYNR